MKLTARWNLQLDETSKILSPVKILTFMWQIKQCCNLQILLNKLTLKCCPKLKLDKERKTFLKNNFFDPRIENSQLISFSIFNNQFRPFLKFELKIEAILPFQLKK